MPLLKTEPHLRKAYMPKTTKQALSDYTLVRAVADRRDHAAFTELYERYQHMAMGLLQYILGNRDRAEDALQEAFLRIWHSANTLRDESNVRGWILRIVAREGARCCSVVRERRTIQVEDFEQRPSVASDQAEGAQEAELLAALGRQLETLAPAQRTVLALHFGGGLSQREIGEVLNLTQQGVGHRLNEALETLRLRLTQAGFAAALPLLSGDGLGQALTHGPAPSAKLFDRILANLELSARGSARMAHVGGAGSLLWVAGMVILAAGLGALWIAARTPEGKALPAKALQTKTEQAALSSDPKHERYYKRWTFENGVPKDIGVVAGKWKMAQNAEDGSQTAAAMPGETLILRLPVPNAALPNEITIKVSAMKVAAKPSLKLVRVEGNRAPPRTLWRDNDAGLGRDPGPIMTLQMTFDGTYDVAIVNGVVASVTRIEERPISMALLVVAEGMAILNIEYRELDPEAAKAEYPRKSIAELEAQGIQAQKIPAQVLFEQ